MRKRESLEQALDSLLEKLPLCRNESEENMVLAEHLRGEDNRFNCKLLECLRYEYLMRHFLPKLKGKLKLKKVLARKTRRKR